MIILCAGGYHCAAMWLKNIRFPNGFAFVLCVLLIACLLAAGGCSGRKSEDTITLVVWGVQLSEETRQEEAKVREFERRNPGVRVSLLSMGAGAMNPQKLMTAIVGKAPPDLVRQDRFTIGDWASRDTFRPLNDLVERDRDEPDGVRPEDYYDATWEEATYKGNLFAIPENTDSRALFYDKEAFREVGLDPERPPRTWDELKDYAIRLTSYNPDGTFRRAGFIPNFGNSFLYIYSWQNGGEFMNEDATICTMDNPYTVEALEYMTSVYDALKGAERLDAYTRGFGALPPEMDPFMIGRVAMKIDGNWFLQNLARYRPNMDFGVAPAPVPRERYEQKGRFAGTEQFITWSGGFSWAIPRGVPEERVEIAWKFIKWMNSPEAWLIGCEAQKEYNASKGRMFVPTMSANRKVNEAVFAEYGRLYPQFEGPIALFNDLLNHSRFRPVTHVGQLLWDEHLVAFENATRHKLSAREALAQGTRRVQAELDRQKELERYPEIGLALPMAVMSFMLLLGVGTIWFFARKSGPVGKLMRGEAVSGYLFASPWILGLVVFTAGPFLASLVFSFCYYDVLHAPKWVGLLNYRILFGEDWGLFSKTLYNAAYLAFFGIPLGIITGLAIAMLLNASVRGMHYYRTVYYLPSIVPIVASSILWIWILNPDAGLLNAGWRVLLTSWSGISPPNWLASEQWAKPALITMGLWGAGGGMILWLAGLQGVPQHLYEAAELDGASPWMQFRHVTLPMLSPYIFFNLIMGTIAALQTFENVYIMTGGGPVNATRVPVLYLFDNAFRYFNMGYASAIAWILFVIVLALTLAQLKMAPRWVHYEAEKK